MPPLFSPYKDSKKADKTKQAIKFCIEFDYEGSLFNELSEKDSSTKLRSIIESRGGPQCKVSAEITNG